MNKRILILWKNKMKIKKLHCGSLCTTEFFIQLPPYVVAGRRQRKRNQGLRLEKRTRKNTKNAINL